MKNNFVLDAEEKIGIDIFLTKSKGTGGKLRFSPEDFFVKEISKYPQEEQNGKYTIADITAVNWETNILIREISKRLRISRNRISFAGTKDKRAKTTQLMSFYNVPAERISKLNIKDVSLENIYFSNKSVEIGDLVGNHFEIIIRNLREETNIKQINSIASSILDVGGFPNFFGIQRFGVIRPITHVVGKNIVKGDLKKAVMSYIANPIKGENDDAFMIREKLQRDLDFNEALKYYPRYLTFEKAILNKLVVKPDDFIGAITELPKNLLTMFIYAYQSFLFNKILSERIKNNIPLNQAIIGDIVLPIRKGIIDQKNIKVKNNNINKVNKQISNGKAVVSSILIGCDSEFSNGKMGEIEHKIVEKEKIDPRDFIITDIPKISSSGSRRGLLATVKKLDYKMFADDLNHGKNTLFLKFDLDKGSYATSLLREFMKTEDIRNY